MANVKVTDLTAYTDPINTDVLPIVDVTTDTTKKVTFQNLLKTLLAKAGGTMTGTITFAAGQTFPTTGIAAASTSQSGIVQLTDSTSSTSTTTAATPNAVKTTYDLANAALPKSGGTMTGALLASSSGTAAAPALSVAGDTDTGVYGKAANQLGVSTAGVERGYFDSSGWNGPVVGAISATSINGGQLAGTRNRVINGGMAVDQRNAGASQTFTAAAALAYSVDRWYGYCTGANVTGQRVQGATVGQFYYRFTGAASVTAIGFGQRIEQLNSADLAGSTATLSVDLANSLLTTVTWTAYYATTADTFGTLASPTRTQIATGTFTVTSTVTRYNTNISVPAAATTGIEIVFTVGAQTSGTWTIGNVQLEAGSVATPFERRSYGHEFALSERYYQKLYVGITLPGATNTSNYTFTVPFRVFPRPVSTSNVSFSSISYANASSLTCASVSSYGFQLLWIATTNGFAGINYAEAVISVEL